MLSSRSCTARTVRTAPSPRCATSLGVTCVGSGLRAGALGMDKQVTKLIAADCGIATAPAVLLTAATATGYRWTRPVVVKPVAAGSSRGVTLVGEPGQLPGAALDAAFALDDRVLAEDVITGREIDLAVLGRPDGTRMIAPALEIAGGGIFGYQDKYGGQADLRVPAALSETDRTALETAAVTMFGALGCAGVARIDFFLTTDGPLLNEVNTMPGFTEHSQVPRDVRQPPACPTQNSSTCWSATRCPVRRCPCDTAVTDGAQPRDIAAAPSGR